MLNTSQKTSLVIPCQGNQKSLAPIFDIIDIFSEER